MNPILETIHQLTSDGYHPQSVRAETEDGNSWTISITLQEWLCGHSKHDQRLDHHVIRFDRENLPDGIDAIEFRRASDHVQCVEASVSQMDSWIREVATMGQSIDVARFGSVSDGRLTILTKPNVWLDPESYAYRCWLEQKK